MTMISHAFGALQVAATRAWPLSALLFAMGTAHAASVPENLGAGLHQHVTRMMSGHASVAPQGRARLRDADSSEMMTESHDGILMRDEQGRILVTIVVHGQHAYDRVRERVRGAGLDIMAEDARYKSGIIEGWVPEHALVRLAKMRGVSAVHAVNRPATNVGAVTQQGVVQHRVDLLPPSLNGTGITVGILSDSYNRATTFASGAPLTIREAQDIASCDLPGAGNPCGNTQPVIVLEDVGGGLDEGRAMAQLIHDMAPKARLGFATAFSGEVAFANNIRALAGIQGLLNSKPDFAAQIIVDDVQYFAEGMFSDTIIAQAVDDVTAIGVSYFSSAGNTPPTQGYASDLRILPAGATATAGTNVNLTGVPSALYAGGFHNFRTDGSQDIAQTINLAPGTRSLRLTIQWDDPYDVTPPTLGAQILQAPGTISVASPAATFVFNNPTAGKQYQVDVQGISDSLDPGGALDVIVAIIQPDGSTLTTVDTGAGETFSFYATQAGNYTVRVTGFAGDTGTFTTTVNETSGLLSVTTDLNLLFFRATDGAYLGCVCENNLATNRPVELPGTLSFSAAAAPLSGQVQMVISRANVPTAPTPATRLRYKMLNAASPAEYFSYTTPITYGHNSAAGANGVAAYSPFTPNIPEDFTSTGPVRIVWDRFNHRIPDAQQIRLKPEMAAMDGGNTTFFTSDTGRDLDTFPNFFGTSAAAPTAAAIAALVLQNKGGPGSVTPAQMRTMLQRSAFQHDLDPYSATGQAIATPNRGKVTVTMAGDNSSTSVTDANGTTISYVGPSHITSITFDATGGNPGGGSVVNPSTPGLVFDGRAVSAGGQPFVVGAGSVGLTAADVTATLLDAAPAPSVAGMFNRLKLDFAPFKFNGGKALRFGLDRDEQRSAFFPPAGDSRNGSSADLAGSIVRIPAGTVASGGITFTGTLADGSTFSGVVKNRIGAGWTFLDGFGFINAESAVSQPIP